MAEVVVSAITGGVVSLVLKKLRDALTQEAVLLCRLRPEVDWLLSELLWMESFLKDADRKRGKGGELAKNWVREVRDVAYRAEDIIDTFMLEIEIRRRRGSKPMGLIKRYAAFPWELIKARHNVAAGLKEVKAKIIGIRASRETYGLVNCAGETLAQASSSATAEHSQPAIRKRIIPYLDDDDDTLVVGFDAHKDRILEMLLDPSIKRRCVVSVVGIGGIGKTTLANKVYKNNRVRFQFDTCACISVSKDYRIHEMLSGIAKQVMGSAAHSMDTDDLKEKIYNFLKGRRYFIVLDDVWRTDAWEQASEALPNERNGSRVMVTTRLMEVAASADSTFQPYQLPFLSKEESWELFTKKAFSHNVKPASIPEELEAVGRRLVTRCGGLPLALMVLGAVVGRKGPNPAVWKRVAERLDWASTQEGEVSLKILALSYNDLPHNHLRLCFLYLGAFPEDTMMVADTLSWLWIAEGFIPNSKTQTMEDTAQAYLQELAQRSMIQTVGADVDGCVRYFRIHDLFRDLCLREAGEDGFLNLYSAYGTDQHELIRHDRTPRRLALHNLPNGEMKPPSPDLRSLLVYHERLTSEIFNGLKLLRVINLHGVDYLAKLPEEITSMIHLRFLRLVGCRDLRELPSSIGNLYNLQTLDVKHTGIVRFPKALGKIQALRHLYLSGCECPPLGNLTNLQSLKCDGAGGWIERGFGHLLNMRDLSIGGLKATQGEAFLRSIRNLKHLSSLELWEAEFILPEFIAGLSNSTHLHQLRLVGRMPRSGQLPGIHWFPPNLTALHLQASNLGQDPMATLEKLQSLVFLELYDDAYVGRGMVCTAGGGFPQLRMLYLVGLTWLEEWRVEAGAMPSLASLEIHQCTSLRMLPEGLTHVTSLQNLTVYDPREEFRARLQQGAGADWRKIQHVRSIVVKERHAGYRRSLIAMGMDE